MKMGAYDYITKPLFPDEILITIKKALETASRDNVILPFRPPTRRIFLSWTTRNKET